MRIEEIRINDIYKLKTDDETTYRVVVEMNNKGELVLNKIGGESWESVGATIHGIVPIEANETTLKSIGCFKNPFVDEYKLIIADKNFCIRKDINSPLWICSCLYKYRPPFVKFRFIHELQRFLLDNYMVTLSL